MKTTQWIIAAVSFMLVFANLRMLGGQDNAIVLIQEHVGQMERNCIGQSDCVKKAEVTRHFLAMLHEQREARLKQAQRGMARHRRFVNKKQVCRSKKHFIMLDRMQDLVQKYTDYLKERDRQIVQSMEQPAPQIIERMVEIEKPVPEPQIVERVVEKIVEIPVRVEVPVQVPVEQEVSKKQDDTIAIALDQMNQKINDLCAQREQDQYMQDMADRTRKVKEKEACVSSDRIALQMNQQPVMQQPQLQMQMPQQQFIAHSMGMPMQNNYQQQMAMQLQSQAMAMQQQASMLMMQQPQQYMQPMMMANYAQPVPQLMPSINESQRVFQSKIDTFAGGTKRGRINKLMSSLHEIADIGEYALQRLMQLINAEFEIIEQLLAGNNATQIQQAVKKKDSLVQMTAPAVVDTYNMVLDLATSADEEINPPYYQFMVKNEQRVRPVANKYKQKNASPKRSFLINMMNALEHYYLIVENMQSAFKTVKR